jgi:hypothetical protein
MTIITPKNMSILNYPSYKIDREGTRLSKRGEDPFDEYKGFDDEEYASKKNKK